MSVASQSNTAFRAQSVMKSGRINLNAPIETVFPLFGAIREKDWTYGWDPEVLFSVSGDMELHMVFRTRSGEEFFTWTVTQYRPEEYFVEYHVTAQDRAWFITVACVPHGGQTKATVTYQYLGFTPAATEKNEAACRQMFASNLSDWEEAINYYLATGKQLH